MKRLFIKSLIFLFGVRFYRTKNEPSGSEIMRTEFRTVHGHEIQFLFYRETFVDIYYRFGIFSNQFFRGFIIKAKLCDKLDIPALAFNNHAYLFKNTWLNKLSDEILADVLLGIYLDFITEQLANNENVT